MLESRPILSQVTATNIHFVHLCTRANSVILLPFKFIFRTDKNRFAKSESHTACAQIQLSHVRKHTSVCAAREALHTDFTDLQTGKCRNFWNHSDASCCQFLATKIHSSASQWSGLDSHNSKYTSINQWEDITYVSSDQVQMLHAMLPSLQPSCPEILDSKTSYTLRL